MDPDANLTETRALAEQALNGQPIDYADAYRLAELVQALDEWLSRGGFPPADWSRRSADDVRAPLVTS